jgi:hypothetical protein
LVFFFRQLPDVSAAGDWKSFAHDQQIALIVQMDIEHAVAPPAENQA